jgi:hypothetical protein
MGQAIPNQHPAVVLRSHFNTMRALLVAALIAVAGLTVAVVILATDDEPASITSPAAAVGQLNYGGFDPATGRPQSVDRPATGARSDGGPEESAVAAAIGSTPTVSGPDESRIADAIGTAEAPATTGGPDESAVAHAITGH